MLSVAISLPGHVPDGRVHTGGKIAGVEYQKNPMHLPVRGSNKRSDIKKETERNLRGNPK